MLERLLDLFRRTTTPKEPLAAPDARMALGILLVQVAMADRTYLFEEVEEIDHVLAHAFDLSAMDAAKMRGRCEDAARRLPKDTNLALIIRNAVDYAHRIEAVEALWAVAKSDGITDTREREMIDLIEGKLGVAAKDSHAARIAAAPG